MQKERLILLELLNILSELQVSKSKVAIKFHVLYCLLKTRLKGRNLQNAKGGYNKALDSDQDDVLR
jgi:hypothetical protein